MRIALIMLQLVVVAMATPGFLGGRAKSTPVNGGRTDSPSPPRTMQRNQAVRQAIQARNRDLDAHDAQVARDKKEFDEGTQTTNRLLADPKLDPRVRANLEKFAAENPPAFQKHLQEQAQKRTQIMRDHQQKIMAASNS